MEFFQHAEGRVVVNGSSFDYEYNLTDHLGNVRVTIDEAGTVVQRDDYYPFGGSFNHYQNTNPPNQYTYNNKELQPETQWLDYGARMYDANLGRFFNQDRFSEKYMSVNPYQYTLNNPIKYIDINGDSVWLSTPEVIHDSEGNVTINYTVNIEGKVLDPKGTTTRSKSLAKGLNSRLNSQKSSTVTTNDQGQTTTTNITIKSNFTHASSMDEVSASDHLVVLVDNATGKGDPKLGGGPAVGWGATPGKISYVEANGAVETAFHEIGHNLGFVHPEADSPENNSSNPMAYVGRGANYSVSQMETILNNTRSGIPNRGSNFGLMKDYYPNVSQGSINHSVTEKKPFFRAPAQNSKIPRPIRFN